MTLRTVGLDELGSRRLFDELADVGAVFVRDDRVPVERFRQALADEAAYFALPADVKRAMSIDGSAHFRGHSVMHNERDWREQAHFGRDASPGQGPEPFRRLQGPNRWPPSEAWRERMGEWFDLTERAGCDVVRRVAAALGSDADEWLGADPYRIVKLIAYHPQPEGSAPRPGVAAHVDFSLVTLTVQDEVGGLQVRRPDGAWEHVEPVEGAWLVHVGELLAFVTGNRVRATPHRVVNPSSRRTRCSMPYFVCPSLDVTLRADGDPVTTGADPAAGVEHVHAVLDPSHPPPTIAFGRAEWRRKGENRWCSVCCTD